MKRKGRRKEKMEVWSKSDRRKLRQKLKNICTNEEWEEEEIEEIEVKKEQLVYVVEKKSRAGSKGSKTKLMQEDNRCYICKRENDRRNRLLQFHHVKPVRCGGDSGVKNGRLLCPTCHRRYHKLFDEEIDKIQGEIEEFVKKFEEQVGKMRKGL